jgi:hypothetical protein
VTSTKAFLKGVETWKKETITKRVLTFVLTPQFHWHISLTNLREAPSSYLVSFAHLSPVILMGLLSSLPGGCKKDGANM